MFWVFFIFHSLFHYNTMAKNKADIPGYLKLF